MSAIEQPTLVPAAKPLAAGQTPCHWPCDYVVCKCKTSGLEPESLIVQICHQTVQDGKVVERASPLLDWSRIPGIDLDDLEARLAALPVRHFTVADLQRHGEDPRDVLQRYLKLLRNLIADGRLLVGHSVFSFDLPLLRDHFEAWLGVDISEFDILQVPVHDVGLIQKMLDGTLEPYPNESSGEFHQRLKHQHLPGVKWSLAHCLQRHQVDPGVPASDPWYHVLAAQGLFEALGRLGAK